MNTKWRKITFIILLVTISYFVYYQYVLTSTLVVATIEKKVESKNKDNLYIIIRTEDGRKLKIKAPDIVWPLLNEGSEYSLNYKHNELRDPFLTYISPID